MAAIAMLYYTVIAVINMLYIDFAGQNTTQFRDGIQTAFSAICTKSFWQVNKLVHAGNDYSL